MTAYTHSQPTQPSHSDSRAMTEGSTKDRKALEAKEGSTHRDRFRCHTAETGFLERDRAYVKNFIQLSDRGDKEIKESREKIAPKILDLQAGGELPVFVQVLINNAIWGSHRMVRRVDIW